MFTGILSVLQKTFLSNTQESFAQPQCHVLTSESAGTVVKRQMSDQKFLWAEEMWIKSAARWEPQQIRIPSDLL